MKILAIGGEGFVGSNFVQSLPNVTPLDNRSFNKTLPKYKYF